MLKFPKGYGLGYAQKIDKNSDGFKLPLLVVGANVYIRQHTKPEFLKDWDIYPLFFPTSNEVYRIGILSVSRSNNTVELSFCENADVGMGINQLLVNPLNPNNSIELNAKALLWLTKSIYACPKIALRDLLACESYKKTA